MKYFESYEYFSGNLSNSIIKYKDWYDENIEPPLVELVIILRNNGFNTEGSCGHKMWIQIQYLPETNLDILNRLIYEYLSENNYVNTYKIITRIERNNGIPISYIEINFIDLEGTKSPHSSQKFANDNSP